MIVVLDADVVIGALDADDAHHDEARKLLHTWQREGATRLVALVNLTEVLVAPAADPARLRRAREAVAALGITPYAPTEAIAVDAARERLRHPISLPDAYALATARHVGGRLRTFDRTLSQIAIAEGIG